MDQRILLALIGDDLVAKNKFVDNLIQSIGDYNFCRNIEELRPLQTWLILENSKSISKIVDLYSQNMIFMNTFLFEVPVEIRIWCKVHLFEKQKVFDIKANKGLQFWELMFKKYIPKDMLK